jgi:hypothetical protein
MSTNCGCDENDVAIIVGSQRVFNVDLTVDGGLPPGTDANDIVLSAFDDLANDDVTTEVVPNGNVLQVTGNIVTIKVAADQPRARVFVTMQYTNPIATPGRQRWEFKFI